MLYCFSLDAHTSILMHGACCQDIGLGSVKMKIVKIKLRLKLKIWRKGVF